MCHTISVVMRGWSRRRSRMARRVGSESAFHTGSRSFFVGVMSLPFLFLRFWPVRFVSVTLVAFVRRMQVPVSGAGALRGCRFLSWRHCLFAEWRFAGEAGPLPVGGFAGPSHEAFSSRLLSILFQFGKDVAPALAHALAMLRINHANGAMAQGYAAAGGGFFHLDLHMVLRRI